ncbi:MAG: hypothetical protein M1511_04965, partial [Deltaproteobacteria bacterium]|nr:hypothetical protein [Deltaproteobacteria bacterium]
KGVSGLLVFKSNRNSDKKTRELTAKYFQTPFAENPIRTDVFPVESKFIIVNQSDISNDMKWVE